MTHLSLFVDSSAMGGIETHMVTLAAGLKAKGFAPVISFLKDYGPHPLEDSLKSLDIPYQKHQGFGDYKRTIKDHRPALIHTHGYKAGILGKCLKVSQDIPVVSTYHSGDPGKGRVFLYNGLDRVMAGLSAPIAVSKEIAVGLPKTTTVIENFVPLPDWENLKSFGRSTVGQIAFVGRLSHEKGPDYFCELACLMPHLSFHMYGDGPMRLELEAKYGREVTFHGMVPSMQDHWRDIGILVMPSRHEGLPMAALEAMSHAIPVCAFAVGGLPDLIAHEENGFLIAPNDLEAMEDCIYDYHRASEFTRCSMAKKAYTHIKDNYARDQAIEKILAVYRSIGAIS